MSRFPADPILMWMSCFFTHDHQAPTSGEQPDWRHRSEENSDFHSLCSDVCLFGLKEELGDGESGGLASFSTYWSFLS